MLFKKTNIKYDIELLKEWFYEVRKNHSDREFDPFNHNDEMEEEYRNEVFKRPQDFNQSGFAIETYYSTDHPQPFFRAVNPIRELVEYHKTPVSFGYINKIISDLSFAKFWSISCQRPKGRIKWHTDKHDEMAIWIPIQVDDTIDCFSIMDELGEEHSFPLVADGHVYIINNSLRHTTYNNSQTERIMIISYFNINSDEGKILLTQ